MAGGNLTDVVTYITFSSFFSRDTVRIGFLTNASKNFNVLYGDIQNDFLEAPTKEKIFFYAEDAWKVDKDKVVIVVRELYGLKYSSLQFRNCSAENLGNRLGYKSYLAEPDIW